MRKPMTPAKADAILKARARRYDRETREDSARQCAAGRCDCGLPFPCVVCPGRHKVAVKNAFAGL
jgi:DTW domain-containing protein YfiP